MKTIIKIFIWSLSLLGDLGLIHICGIRTPTFPQKNTKIVMKLVNVLMIVVLSLRKSFELFFTPLSPGRKVTQISCKCYDFANHNEIFSF